MACGAVRSETLECLSPIKPPDCFNVHCTYNSRPPDTPPSKPTGTRPMNDGIEKKESVDLPAPNVLLVDDTPENLVALEVVLEDLDCNLIKATSGQQALGTLLKKDVSLVLLDVQMPEMD